MKLTSTYRLSVMTASTLDPDLLDAAARRYHDLGADGWPDATLVGHVADRIRVPRAAPADSFVLHAPLELLARGTWSGVGVLGPEAFDAVPFLDLLTEYGSPWGRQEVSG